MAVRDEGDRHANAGGSATSSHEPKTRVGSTSHSDNDNDPIPQKEFAELGSNPFPELAFDSDCLPEPVMYNNADHYHAHNLQNQNHNDNQTDLVSPLTDGTRDLDDASTRAAIEPDLSDTRGPAVVYAEPDRSWIAKHKTWVITGLIVAVIIMIGVTIGVVEVEKAKNSGGSGGGGGATTSAAQISSSSFTPSVTTGTTSTGATSTALSTGSATSTSTPSACTDTSDFLTKVSWMGIADATGGWSVSYASTTDATNCCVYCYQSISKGCDAWAWIPDDSTGSIITACNVISGWNGTDADDTCPSGYTSVQFSLAGTNASHVGQAGPCASVASS